MKKIALQMGFIVSFILLISCQTHRNPRTVTWSGSTFSLTGDTTKRWKFYLGYYIEFSDTGDVKMITRMLYNAPREYYRIMLSDSIKNQLLNLAFNPSNFADTKREDNPSYIYDGFIYRLRIQGDTIDKSMVYIPPSANYVQKELARTMDGICRDSLLTRIPINKFDTELYEKVTEKDILQCGEPLPQIGKTIIYTPPIVAPGN